MALSVGNLRIVNRNDSADDPELDYEPGPEFEPDPAPDEPRAPSAKTPARQPRTRANSKLAKEVAEDLKGLIELGSVAWGISDECCAPILEEQAKPIADSIAAILSRNPRLLEKFANTDIAAYTLAIGALGKALTPVGKAIYHNHVNKAVDDDGIPDRIDPAAFPDFPAFAGISRQPPAGGPFAATA